MWSVFSRLNCFLLLLPLFLAPQWAPGQAPDVEAILNSFSLHPDFKLELVAMEPVLFDPVDLEFDEQGRAFVIEMPGYPEGGAEGSIVMLVDSDGDGRYDQRKVYAEGFPYATSILPCEGGFLVVSPPDILFLKDTDGDGTADLRETLLTGFALDNTQHNANGLIHGLDGWVYAANGGNSGSPYWSYKAADTFSIRGQDFRFRLDTREFEPIGRSSGGFGLAMDKYGRLFETHNTWHISHLVFPGRYLDAIPGEGDSLENVSDHEEGGLARIYPIGPQVTRVNHPEQSGYFSGACGITYYGGGAFPAEFNGNFFVMDVVVNIVHRDVPHPAGASFSVSRGRPGAEFLASTDRAFRPVNATVGPDGALYLLDMHRDVIEHPEWIPDEIEATMDLDAGKNTGRLFRITPKGGLPHVSVAFDRSDLPGTVKRLDHPNKWWRDTAQRLLQEWKDPATPPLLEALFESATTSAGRLHALWTLNNLDVLSPGLLQRALADTDAGVREAAVILAEARMGQDRKLRRVVETMASDPDARVRMQTALSLGAVELGEDKGKGRRRKALLEIARQDADGEYTRLAVLPGLARDPMAALNACLKSEELCSTEGGMTLAGRLAALAGKQVEQDAVEGLLVRIARMRVLDPGDSAGLLAGLAEGLGKRPSGRPEWQLTTAGSEAIESLLGHASLEVVRETWRITNALTLPSSPRQQQLLDSGSAIAADENAPSEQRLEYLTLLEFADFAQRKELLFSLLDTRHPSSLQLEAIEQLTRSGGEGIAERLIAMWKTLAPEVRNRAGNYLLHRGENHHLLLSALENGDIAIGQMDFNLERRRRLLWWTDDEEVKRRAEALFTDAGVVTRKEALDKMRPALELAGDPERGHTSFRDLCAKCHIMGGEGFDVAPNLTEIYRKSAETLLHDILDPNAAVDTKYISYSVEIPAGDGLGTEIVTGILIAEDDTTITLREAEGKQRTLERRNLKNLFSTGLSLMPEELEAGMDPQVMADLLAFLQQPR